MKQRITIKAAFADAIDRLQFFRSQFKELKNKTVTKTEDHNEIKKDDLVDIIQ